MEFSEQDFQRSPSDSSVLASYGEALIATGDEEQGIGMFERAVELDLANGAAYINLGTARWRAGDRDGAIVAMRRAVELDPRRYTYQRALGMAEAALGNRAEGAARVRLSERLDPDPEPSLFTAYAYRVVGLHDDAARVANAWAEMLGRLGRLPRGSAAVLYYLVLDEEEQALDTLALFLEGPTASSIINIIVLTNAYDDPTLDKPEFEALRAEIREKFGWN